MSLIPADWMPPADMQRIITHWTGGGYAPSADDKKHYHILIDGDSKLHRGTHSITDNDRDQQELITTPGSYAAHTKGTNGHSIGITVCCMAKATPRNPGKVPMKQSQWETMATVANELTLQYNIPISPTTVLGHGEVQKQIGNPQERKWDPMVLPWDTEKSFDQVGEMFREQVRYLKSLRVQPFIFFARVFIQGFTFGATLEFRFTVKGLGAGVADHPLGRNRWSCISSSWQYAAKASHGYFWFDEQELKCYDKFSSRDQPAFLIKNPPKWNGDMSPGSGWILRPAKDGTANSVIKWRRMQ